MDRVAGRAHPVRDRLDRVVDRLRAGRAVEARAAEIAAGASLVQLYTGLIYRGPALVKECAAALAAR